MSFILLILIATVAQVRPVMADLPRQKVVLLTSVDLFETARNVPFYLAWRRSHYYQYTAKLEAIFREYFNGRGFDVEVYHYTDQALLWGILHSGEYVGVYWISHGANNDQSEGLSSDGLFDYQRFNVAALLQHIHPNLRVLGVAGCFSMETFQRLQQSQPWAESNSALTVFSYGNRVEATLALPGLLAAGSRVLDRPEVRAGYSSSCPRRKGLPIRVRRICRSQSAGRVFYPAVRFESADGRVLGTMLSCEPGEEEQRTLFLDLETAEPGEGDLKIVATLGNSPADKLVEAVRPEIGEIEITTPVRGLGEWELLKRGTGKAVGVFRHIYRFKGQTPDAWGVWDYSPFFCRPMPARH